MTAATEKSAAGPLDIVVAISAPALVLAAAVVPFLRFHEYSLVLPESLILVGGSLLIGSAVGALALLRRETLAPMLMALVLGVYIFFRQEVTDLMVNTADAVAPTPDMELPALVCLGVALFLGLCVLCVLLKQHLDKIVAAVFGTIVLTTLALPTVTGGEPIQAGAVPAERADLPPVVHIILDEHIGLASLPEEHPGSAAAATAMRETFKDFAIYSHAYSRFAETKFSLTSLLNGDLGSDVTTALKGSLYEFLPKRNAWFDRLSSEGYAIKVYQSAWYDMCALSPVVDACYTFSFFSPNAIQRSPLSTSARLRALTKKLFIGRGALQMEPLVSYEALQRFRTDIAAAPRGAAWIVHLLTPHYGYLYDKDCRLIDPAYWERDDYGDDSTYTDEERAGLYDRYLEQLVCADRQMVDLFDHMKALGIYDEATIIVHGDHGSRLAKVPYITPKPEQLTEADLLDHYATLLAIKAPGVTPGIRPEPVVLQHVFAEEFLGGGRPDTPGNRQVMMRIDEKNTFGAVDFAWPSADVPVALSGIRGAQADGPLSDDRIRFRR